MIIQSHYKVLNVSSDASIETIRTAYDAVILKCQAELSPNADASRFLNAVNHAYAVLSDPIQRAEYDHLLDAQNAQNIEKKKTQTRATPVNVPLQQSPIAPTAKTLEPQPAPVVAKKTSLAWLLYFAIAVVALFALKSLGVFNVSKNSEPQTESSDASSAPITAPVVTESDVSATASPTASEISPNEASADTLPAPANTVIIPEHDAALMNQFIGAWHGKNNSNSNQQILIIKPKTTHSLEFRLDAKQNQKVGAVFGVAEFENNYLRFYNKEYDCMIVLSLRADKLTLSSSNCNAFHAEGVIFDGDYIKPSAIKPVVKKPVATSKTSASTPKPTPAVTPLTPVVATPAPANSIKLLKFSASVKDADGTTRTIELVAKDKEAARAIIRDYRGNPKVLKIKEIKR